MFKPFQSTVSTILHDVAVMLEMLAVFAVSLSSLSFYHVHKSHLLFKKNKNSNNIFVVCIWHSVYTWASSLVFSHSIDTQYTQCHRYFSSILPLYRSESVLCYWERASEERVRQRCITTETNCVWMRNQTSWFLCEKSVVADTNFYVVHNNYLVFWKILIWKYN